MACLALVPTRRCVVAAVLLLAPLAALAQPAPRVPVVGLLSTIPSQTPQGTQGQAAFEQGLRELGWIPGQSVRLEYRNPEGKMEQLDALARELAHLGVNVIVARGTPAITSAKKATTTIPIVMAATGGDPVLQGLVTSLARPGGNVTGLTLLNQDTLPKQIQLLKEIVPQMSRVAVLGGPSVWLPAQVRRDVEAAATGLGLKLQFIDLARADQLDGTFADLPRNRIDGLVVRADVIVLEPNREKIAALARKHRVPAIYWLRAYVEAGGLISYGTDLLDVHRRSAWYVDRILRGARAADLPVEQPSTLRLVVNLKTAREIGLTVPPSILVRADEVLQ